MRRRHRRPHLQGADRVGNPAAAAAQSFLTTPVDAGWCEDAQALLAWHGIDPARIAREDLWRMYRRGDSAIEAARLTANMARQEQEAWAAQGR